MGGAAPEAQSQPVPPPQAVPPSTSAYQNAPPAGAKKKSPWMWVLMGCLGLIVIGGLATGGLIFYAAHKAKQAGLDPDLMKRNPALAVAKLAVAANPDLEMVSVDEDRGTLTVLEKSTGKKTTVSFEDAKNGKIVFRDDQGQEATIQGDAKNGSLVVKTNEGTTAVGASWTPPAWLPNYTGAKVEGGSNVQSPASDGGMASLTTNDSVDDVLKFYEDALTKGGLKVSKQITSGDGTSRSGTLTAQDAEGKKSANITAATDGGPTKIVLTYSENKK